MIQFQCIKIQKKNLFEIYAETKLKCLYPLLTLLLRRLPCKIAVDNVQNVKIRNGATAKNVHCQKHFVKTDKIQCEGHMIYEIHQINEYTNRINNRSTIDCGIFVELQLMHFGASTIRCIHDGFDRKMQSAGSLLIRYIRDTQSRQIVASME